MNLSDILSELATGELFNLALVDTTTKTIKLAEQKKVVRFINEGLVKIYTRLLLKEKDLILELQEHVTFYHLISRFTRSNNSSTDIQYILDLVNEPYLDDLSRVLRVIDSHGYDVPINDDNLQESVFTPQYQLLQVPYPVQGKLLTIIYQALHPILSENNLTHKVELPVHLLPALYNYVAHKVYSYMNTAESSNKGIEHLKLFDLAVQDTIMYNTSSTSRSGTRHKQAMRRFV